MIIIENIHRLRLSLFYPLLRVAEEAGEAKKGTFQAWGIEYTARYYPNTEGGLLSLAWSYEGKEREERIRIERRGSNLMKSSSVYYFICPYCGKAGRLLFTNFERVFGRRAFRHSYKAQTLSRKDRVLASLWSGGESGRKGGKEYYRGSLTPYGKRLEKHIRNQERALTVLYNDLKSI